jgi:hypothetical protein
MFFRGSRYESVAEDEITARDGRTIRYKRMRFIPDARGSLSYTVRQGDRPDLAAYNTLGDPEQFWRLCDVNRIQRPADLTRAPGTQIQVPGPGGR